MQPTAQALSRTYSDRVYPDPWEKVLDYRRVLDYAAEHPNAGRVRVGNALELPPSRVRGWLNDSVPDPVRGINTASQYGWLDSEPDSDTAAALVELLAHVLAGGTIPEQSFEVAVTEGRRVGVDEIRAAFERVGVETRIRHCETDDRATEVVPTTGASVLGRCLVAMGAARGEKTRLERLPSVVWEVPTEVRTEFARIYVGHRATTWKAKATLRIQEQRPQSYLDDLRRLIAELTGESVTVGDLAVTVSADAARELGLA
jgi:hypothetical protein